MEQLKDEIKLYNKIQKKISNLEEKKNLKRKQKNKLRILYDQETVLRHNIKEKANKINESERYKSRWYEITKYFRPNLLFFPIFWAPILLIIIPALMGSFADIIAIRTNSLEGNLGVKDIHNLFISICKNLNLGYLSVDVWALISLVSSATKRKTGGFIVMGLSHGVIIGIFSHMLFYFFIAITHTYPWALATSIILTLIGSIGVVMIRGAILDRIESVDINEIIEADYFENLKRKIQKERDLSDRNNSINESE